VFIIVREAGQLQSKSFGWRGEPLLDISYHHHTALSRLDQQSLTAAGDTEPVDVSDLEGCATAV